MDPEDSHFNKRRLGLKCVNCEICTQIDHTAQLLYEENMAKIEQRRRQNEMHINIDKTNDTDEEEEEPADQMFVKSEKTIKKKKKQINRH